MRMGLLSLNCLQNCLFFVIAVSNYLFCLLCTFNSLLNFGYRLWLFFHLRLFMLNFFYYGLDYLWNSFLLFNMVRFCYLFMCMFQYFLVVSLHYLLMVNLSDLLLLRFPFFLLYMFLYFLVYWLDNCFMNWFHHIFMN